MPATMRPRPRRRGVCASAPRPPGAIRASSSLLLGLRCFLSFLLPGAPQYVAERIVGFVASIFVNALIGRRPAELAGPRPTPRVRVFYREAIQKCFVVHARQALDYVKVFRRSTK